MCIRDRDISARPETGIGNPRISESELKELRGRNLVWEKPDRERLERRIG